MAFLFMIRDFFKQSFVYFILNGLKVVERTVKKSDFFFDF